MFAGHEECKHFIGGILDIRRGTWKTTHHIVRNLLNAPNRRIFTPQDNRATPQGVVPALIVAPGRAAGECMIIFFLNPEYSVFLTYLNPESPVSAANVCMGFGTRVPLYT